MARGLPFSLMLHVAFLVMVFVFGNYVAQPPLKPQRVLRVRLSDLPQPEPTRAVLSPPVDIAPSEEPLPETQQTPPVAEPIAPEPEPRHVPEKAPEDKQKPAPDRTKQDRPPAEPSPETQDIKEPSAVPLAAGPVASATDEPFPFAWYLTLVEGRISRHWSPRQLGFRETSQRSCVVHFFIERSGAVSRATIAESSGVALFDREALRAVQAAHPLPKLPAQFSARALGVTFIFTLRSGP